MLPSRSELAALTVAMAACSGTTRGTAASRCTHDRVIVLDSQQAIERYRGCASLGSIEIRSGGPLSLAPLRALETIEGDLRAGPTIAFDELSLFELRTVTGAIEVANNTSLRGILLPRLERAGRIAIEANASVTTVSMPRLAQVGGSLLILTNGSLELVDVSSLVTIGKDLVIHDNPRLALVEAEALARVLEVRVDGNPALPDEQAASLAARASVSSGVGSGGTPHRPPEPP